MFKASTGRSQRTISHELPEFTQSTPGAASKSEPSDFRLRLDCARIRRHSLHGSTPSALEDFPCPSFQGLDANSYPVHNLSFNDMTLFMSLNGPYFLEMFDDRLGLYTGLAPLRRSIILVLLAWLLWKVVGAYTDYRVR